MKKIKVLIGIISVGTLILIALGVVVARFDTIQTNTAATAELRRDLKKLVPSISRIDVLVEGKPAGLDIKVYTPAKLDEATAEQVLDRVKQYVTVANLRDVCNKADNIFATAEPSAAPTPLAASTASEVSDDYSDYAGFMGVSLYMFSTDKENADYCFYTNYNVYEKGAQYSIWHDAALE